MKESKAKTQGRNLKAGTKAETMGEFYIEACFPWLAQFDFFFSNIIFVSIIWEFHIIQLGHLYFQVSPGPTPFPVTFPTKKEEEKKMKERKERRKEKGRKGNQRKKPSPICVAQVAMAIFYTVQDDLPRGSTDPSGLGPPMLIIKTMSH